MNQQRRLLRALALLSLLAGAMAPCLAGPRTIAFATDGKEQERKYLWKDDSRVFVLEGWARPVRNVDGKGRYAIWRFDVAGATKARLRVDLLNSFALSVSRDGTAFRELAREAASGGSNEGWKTFHLDTFLPAEALLVKLEHGAPERWNGGFGASVFAIKLEVEDDRDVALAVAARASAPITLDGRLDEEAWQRAQPLATLSDRFMRRLPGRRTTFRLTYDDEDLYAGATCEQPGADKALISAREHDSAVYADDCVEVFLAPPGQEAYYHLAVNAVGATFDERRSEGAATWESGARAVVTRTPEGWTAEIALPTGSLRVDRLEPGAAWRVGLYRNVMELAQWAACSSVEGGGWHSPHRFGVVRLCEPAAQPLPAVNLEPPGAPTLGRNLARIRLSGKLDPTRHRLSLDVLPLKSPSLPEAEQDLQQMNPSFREVGLPAGPTEAAEASYDIDRFGAAHVVATLRDRATGEVLSRAVQSVTVTRAQAAPLELTLRQPYVSTEKELPARVSLHLEGEGAGAALHVALRNAAGKPVWQRRVAVVKGGAAVAIPVAGLEPGAYTARFEARAASGKALAAVERPVTKYVPAGKPSRVAISKGGVCTLNGKAILPLGFMLAPPVRDIRDAGYDVALYGGETLKGRGDLDTAARNGVFALLHLCGYLRGNNDLDAIRAVVSLRKNEPGLFGWYLADEPEAYGDTPEVLRGAYQAIKEVDTDHPVVILTNAPGMLSHYKGCADVIMADPYPIPAHPLTLVADWTDAAVSAAKANGQAVWMTPQGFGLADIGGAPADTPSPTCEELSNMLFTCLIHGAKGIIWWPYSVPRQSYWMHFRKMARQCRMLEPWLLHGKDVPGMPAGIQRSGLVHWRAWQHQGKVAVLAANLSRRPQRLEVPLPKGTRAVRLPFEGVTLTPSAAADPPCIRQGRLILPLAPVQSVVLTVGRPRGGTPPASQRSGGAGPLRLRAARLRPAAPARGSQAAGATRRLPR